ncbi:MarR family transcriptional regulator [Hyphomonas polymorpha PS728]|uniref:MarR family transcriptional regulator n=1 Tax=Hyphomonas polymorpha PS728 TaxID=1280954 RepID=A0A062V4P0_9PROT|nr:MarR family winged helix-turn-helix transcriptional regulator [Hyphomonas polymorpha]KCZ96882.1 MarR family transcriptional regulator [Hyphomonas polymorpha PS728]
MKKTLPFETTLEVYNRCLCFGMHRAARTLARRFDAAFAPLGISHGQYSLMVSLNRPEPPRLGETAAFLAMDRTTLTANLKPLERLGYVEIVPDKEDKRSRRLILTEAGRKLLAAAVPIWRKTHDEVDTFLSSSPNTLRTQLMEVAASY